MVFKRRIVLMQLSHGWHTRLNKCSMRVFDDQVPCKHEADDDVMVDDYTAIRIAFAGCCHGAECVDHRLSADSVRQQTPPLVHLLVCSSYQQFTVAASTLNRVRVTLTGILTMQKRTIRSLRFCCSGYFLCVVVLVKTCCFPSEGV